MWTGRLWEDAICAPPTDHGGGVADRQDRWHTVRRREIRTSISEASKGVPIFLHDVRGSKLFSKEELGPRPLRLG